MYSKYSKGFTMTAWFLLLLLLINETGGPVKALNEEKKVCKYESHKFSGLCFSDTRCASVCKREGFQGGDCQGLRRKCYCINVNCG